MITLDDFVMLGKTVPEDARRTERVMVCSAGYSPTLRRHVFVPSGQRSYGHRICTCGSLERDSVHRVPETSRDAREVDNRKVGECARSNVDGLTRQR